MRFERKNKQGSFREKVADIKEKKSYGLYLERRNGHYHLEKGLQLSAYLGMTG